MILLLAMASLAMGPAVGQEPAIPVAVCGGPEAVSNLVGQAKALANEIFAEAGIRIEWVRCSKPNPAGAIVISILGEQDSNGRAGALAIAHPFEGTHIQIFLDRIKEMGSERFAPKLMGHVMAHEITHMLQMCDTHSISGGVMKAKWDRTDFSEMGHDHLTFAPSDIRLLHMGISKRMAARKS